MSNNLLRFVIAQNASGITHHTIGDVVKIEDVVREQIAKTCELPVDPKTLSDDADLYAAGLTSFASVQLMLALEGAFDLEFPDRLLNRKTFGSIRTISDAVAGLGAGQDAA